MIICNFLSFASFLIFSFTALIPRINSRIITVISTSASWLAAFKVDDSMANMVAQAISRTQQWADDNFMLLNPEKTATINFLINYKHVYDQLIVLDNNVSIFPSKEVKFLGVTLDDHLTFSSHVDNIVSSCNSKLYLLRQLKKLGMNSDGLKRFFTANIRSIISYAAPAWFSMLSDLTRAGSKRFKHWPLENFT